MKIESNVEVPVTPVDFKRILRRLINNPRNQGMVYDVFHKFHRDRLWIADAIDKWFQYEKMMLEGEVQIQQQNGKCAKIFATDHSGFSSVAQTVKAQLMKSYMLHMLQNTGWCIATTFRKTEYTKTVYTKIKLPDCKDHYYVVTMLSKESSCQQCIASGIVGTTNSCSASHQEILDEDSVDISGVESKINQEYILSTHRLLSGAKLAGSLASPLQINPTCEDDDVLDVNCF